MTALLIGYARVSTSAQDAQMQRDALVADGVQQRDIFADVTSGLGRGLKPYMHERLAAGHRNATMLLGEITERG